MHADVRLSNPNSNPHSFSDAFDFEINRATVYGVRVCNDMHAEAGCSAERVASLQPPQRQD